LHEKRWSKDGGSELSGHPRLVSFQRDLVGALAAAEGTGLLRFDELWVEGECRASVYGLERRGTFYYYNSGYDLEWSSFSVGLVLIGLSVEKAIERGNTRYDFLRGDETYKFDWANEKTELVTASLRAGTLPAVAHEAGSRAWIRLRDISKSALPADLIGKLKSRRREWNRAYRLSDLKIEKPEEVL
jgi:CelD/BcsL family acetyltransferase involved in cellulose biosynthesis